MLEIKFNDLEVKYEVKTLLYLNDRHVVYTDCKHIDLSGFIAYVNNVQGSDLSQYTTLYKVDDNYIYYSNDGSVYQEPTTMISATFDGVKPESVEVLTSNGLTLTLKDNFIEKVNGDSLTIVRATQFDEYNLTLNNNIAIYTFKSEEQKIQEEIANLKQKLNATDYIYNSIREGGRSEEYYAETIANRKAWRKRIQELEGTGD